MVDMRHGLNNALTSILGNSELLLLEPGGLSSEQRDQITTMHSMTLRIHEILQRFTSLELEMKLYSQSHHEIPLLPRTMIQASSPASDLVVEPSQAAHRGGVS
jgi:signal transduction histidine kinase